MTTSWTGEGFWRIAPKGPFGHALVAEGKADRGLDQVSGVTLLNQDGTTST